MHRDLARCRDGVLRAIDRVNAAEADAADPGGAWSVAGILEHLDLAFSANAAGAERLLLRGIPKVGGLSLKQRIGRGLILTLGYFPSGREAPESVKPRGRRFVEVAAVIAPHLMVLDDRLRQVEERFGRRHPVLSHPVLGPFSVDDWRRFHWVHTRHHLRQIASRAGRG